MSQPALDTPATLWTIGHSTRSTDELLDVLRAHEINCVADVRRFAGSRKNPQFNPEALEASLPAAGVEYVQMPELGGRRKPRPDSPHTAWRHTAFRGYADYMDTPEFVAAAEQLAWLAHRRRVAIMCSEAVWWRCHRSMIADYFKAHGWRVLHIQSAAPAKEHPYTPVATIVEGRLTY